MSLPTEIDWALIKKGDGESPEVFTLICGIQDVQINGGANVNDRYVRDCTTPGVPPFRKTRVTGKQLDISGSGLSNADTIADLNASIGVLANFKVELYADDGTDTGDLLGTYAGAFRLTTNNLSATREGDSSGEINLASDGAWTYVAAV